MLRKFMMIATAAMVLTAIAGEAALAADWVLRHRNTGSSCWIEKADASGVGIILARSADDTEICKAALSMKSDDGTEPQKCFVFTQNTIDFCHLRHIELDK